jgi:hypothetical protein
MKEVLDSDYPLLEKFKSLAPGSYQHCHNVMNLCEVIAKDLKLDVEIIKIAAMYHDIGKMYNPGYFSENIAEENPHDKLDPSMSYQILTRHVSDSIAILINEKNISREILEIISRHHGDSILQAIYNKVKDTGVSEFNYRYKSQKPNCPYSSVLMIVDAVEAKAKALHGAGKLETREEKVNVVSSTIDYLKEEEQLDEMKVGTLRKVKDRLIRELDSIYHTRVQYDKEDEPGDINE